MIQRAETRLEGNHVGRADPHAFSAPRRAQADRGAGREVSLPRPLNRSLMARSSRRWPGRGGGSGGLPSGEYGTLAELADAERISRSYVCRVLRLTLLAPEHGRAHSGRATNRRARAVLAAVPDRMGKAA